MALIWYNPNAVEPPEIETPYRCPECGASLSDGDEMYVNENGVIVGCVMCVKRKYPEEVFDERGFAGDD